jgi:hypothetical protein
MKTVIRVYTAHVYYVNVYKRTYSICLYKEQVLIGCLVGYHLLLTGFKYHGNYIYIYIYIYINVCVVNTVVVVMLLRNIGHYGIIRIYCFRLSHHFKCNLLAYI